METILEPGSVIVDREFGEMLQDAARALVEASATINAQMTRMEQTCPYANEETVAASVKKMKQIAGDMAMVWERLDQGLADYNLGAS